MRGGFIFSHDNDISIYFSLFKINKSLTETPFLAHLVHMHEACVEPAVTMLMGNSCCAEPTKSMHTDSESKGTVYKSVPLDFHIKVSTMGPQGGSVRLP